MKLDFQAIDAVTNIMTPEALAGRPDRRAFHAKMRVQTEVAEGVTLERLLEMMDAAGSERAMLIAAKVGQQNHPSCYHVPYELVRDAVRRFPTRFYGLAGLDPTEGMQGVRNLELAVKEYGFIGAHGYPHWYELAPDHARWYPFYAKCVELGIPIQLQVGQSMIYDPPAPLRKLLRDNAIRVYGLDLA